MLTEQMINDAWNNATEVEGYDPNSFRKDCCGAWIVRNAYGNTNSPFGWEIDHVYPESKGGKSDPQNLRAMHWENNRSKGDDYPAYRVSVQSEGNRNKHVNIQLVVNDRLQAILTNLYNIR